MSFKVPVSYIDIRVLAHATEDVSKVIDAVRHILPSELDEKIIFKRTVLKGHYGNSITVVEARIRKRDDVRIILEELASRLNALDKEHLGTTIKRHLDKRDLFIRLDKQSAYLNKLELRSDDPIRFQIHFRVSGLDEIMDICRKYGMLL